MVVRVTILAGVISLGALSCGPAEPSKVAAPVVEIAAEPSAAPSAGPEAPPPVAEAEAPRAPVASAPARPRKDDRGGARADTGPAVAAPPQVAQGSAPPPNPAQIQQARQLFMEGVQHHAAGRYADARDAFLAAYQTYPNARVLFNASASAFLAGDVQTACNLLRQWKRDANPTPEQLANVNPQLSQRCP